LANWAGFTAAKAEGMELAAIYRASLASGSSPPKAASTSSRTPRPAGLDAATLATIESTLGYLVGPKAARERMQRAAPESADLKTLLDTLVQGLDFLDYDERRIFRKKVFRELTGAGSQLKAGSTSDQTPRRPKRDWDPAVLKSVATELEEVVGYVAGRLVWQASLRCADLATLLSFLIDNLDNLDRKLAFISKARAAGLIRQDLVSTPASGWWDPGTLVLAKALLTKFVGSSEAGLMVQEAAQRCDNLEGLVSILVGGLGNPDERDDFRRAMTREAEARSSGRKGSKAGAGA
jgi:hypothetical protein